MINKKAQEISIIVKLVLALVVIGIMVYIGYKYILGTGEKIGGLSDCEAQGGNCIPKGDSCSNGVKLPGLCESEQACCIKQEASPQ